MLNTFALADFQQATYGKIMAGQAPSTDDVKRLTSVSVENVWIESARVLAPDNLVIRQYILKDYVNSKADHYDAIMAMLKKLTYWQNGAWRLLFGESYSYYIYCRGFLILYCSKFGNSTATLGEFISMIDTGFQVTAYLNGTVMYPAPFADLRDVPLDPPLQDPSKILPNIDLFPVAKRTLMDGTVEYKVKGCALGYNGHVQISDSKCSIVNGVPTPFTWYTGYDKKFPKWYSQWVSMADPRRLLSLYRVVL